MSIAECASEPDEGVADRGARAGSPGIASLAEGGRPSPDLLAPEAAMVMAVSIGLGAGYVDVALIVFKRLWLNPEGYYRVARDFPWSVPAAHAALLAVPGAILAAAARLRPGAVSTRAGGWLLAALGIWGALSRLPLYGWSSLLLAGRLGRLVGNAVADRGMGRHLRRAAVVLLGLLGVLAALTSGRQALREYREAGALPEPPRARNVVLIV